MRQYKVLRSFERYDETLGSTRVYARGSIISPKDAAQIKSLQTLIAAGNIYEEVALQ